MPLVTFILPGTDAELRVTLKDVADAPITAGTVTATVRSPTGATLASGVTLSHLGSGVWKLPIDEAWSAGPPFVLGEFTAVITAAYSGNTLVTRVRWPVMFADTE